MQLKYKNKRKKETKKAKRINEKKKHLKNYN